MDTGSWVSKALTIGCLIVALLCGFVFCDVANAGGPGAFAFSASAGNDVSIVQKKGIFGREVTRINSRNNGANANVFVANVPVKSSAFFVGGNQVVANVNALAVPSSTVFLNANKVRFNAFGTSTQQDAFGNVFEVDAFGNARFIGNRAGLSGFSSSRVFGFSGHLAPVSNVVITNGAFGVRSTCR